MRRAAPCFIKVEIPFDEVDDDDLMAVMRDRGLDRLTVDLGRFRVLLARGDYREALRCLKAGLPSEFIGFADTIAAALVRTAA